MAKMINLSDLINKANGKEKKDNSEAKKALRKEYKQKAAQLHPDHGGDADQMAKLNEEYQTKEALLDIDDDLREAIEKIITLPGINIEVCGSWVWVSGDTKTNKDTIKAAGYRWAHKKMMWYYRKEDDAQPWHRRKGAYKDMSYIREKYGSDEIKNTYSNARLTA